MKVKHFTDKDLDGVTCTLLAYRAFGKDNVLTEFIGTYDLDKRLTEFIESGEVGEYDYVYITDISINNAQLAERINKDFSSKFILLDHHKTALWLNQYQWASVRLHIESNHRMESASSLFCYYLLGQGYDQLESMIKLVEKVRKYDTWEWKEDNDQESYNLNTLFYLLGREEFMEYYLDWDNSNNIIMECHKTLLEREYSKIKKYIENRIDQLIKLEIQGKLAGIAFAEQYINELAEEIYLNHQVDFAIIINMGTGRLSFRTNKSCGMLDIAKSLGGGGHEFSCGASISNDKVQNFVKSIFGGLDD